MIINWKRGIAGYARPQTFVGRVIEFLVKRTDAVTETVTLIGSIDRQIDLSGSIDRQVDMSGGVTRIVEMSGQLRS